MTSKEALDRLKFIADKELNTGSKSYKDLQEFWNYKEPLKVIEDLVERDTPMKVVKTPHERLLELGWEFGYEDEYTVNYGKYFAKSLAKSLSFHKKHANCFTDERNIDLELAEILVDYLKELENERTIRRSIR